MHVSSTQGNVGCDYLNHCGYLPRLPQTLRAFPVEEGEGVESLEVPPFPEGIR